MALATTSVARGNLLLLSSKRSQSLHTNPCSIKSIEFRGLIASSRLNKVKVKCCTTKSNLISASNNNMATPFKFEAPFRCSSSKENAFGKSVIDNIVRVVQWLKVPATVMAWSLLLGMIMYRRKSALASSGGSTGGGSFSSSRRWRSHHSSHEDRPKSSEEIEMTVSDACIFLLLFIIALVPDGATIFKLQVGLLLVNGEDLKRKLNQIAKPTFTSYFYDRGYILKETIKSLYQYRRNWISSCLYVENVISRKNVEHVFNRLSNEERKIFYKGTLINLDNTKMEIITSTEKETNQTKSTYMVVTILVSLKGKHKLPAISDGKGLHDALEKLKSNSSKVQAVNVFWAPRKANEILSLAVLQKKFPLLKCFSTK